MTLDHTPTPVERQHALEHIMRALLVYPGDLMHAARTREVLCHHFDRAEVSAAWNVAMREWQEASKG